MWCQNGKTILILNDAESNILQQKTLELPYFDSLFIYFLPTKVSISKKLCFIINTAFDHSNWEHRSRVIFFEDDWMSVEKCCRSFCQC